MEKNITYGDVVEGLYSITSDGKTIKNLKTKKIISQRDDKDGYKVANLTTNANRDKTFKVHRLVAWEFCPNDDIENKTQVNHINEVKSDNDYTNLEWVTPKYNINYGARTLKSKTKREKAIILKNVNSGDVFLFQSITNACSTLNLDMRHLGEVLKGNRKTVQGYTAYYAVSPVYNVIPVPIEKIQANTYNPNSVAPPEMELLYQSIKSDKYTMPIVCYYLEDIDKYEIVDGYHRYTTMLRHKDIYDREGGMLPVSVIDKPISDRMASTIRHNRARGSHSVDLMVNIVKELTESGMSDMWIIKNIGMDKDELLRLKQLSGLASLFVDRKFSEADEEE